MSRMKTIATDAITILSEERQAKHREHYETQKMEMAAAWGEYLFLRDGHPSFKKANMSFQPTIDGKAI